MDLTDIKFIQNSNGNENSHEQNDRDFTVLLNGQKDLDDQLEEFKKVCETHNKHQRKRGKRRYYNLALMAEILNCTTHEEVKCLLKNNTKTFLIDIVTNKPQEVEAIVSLIRRAVNEHQLDNPDILITFGLALQITGDCCRIGRNRNSCSLFLDKSSTITLTTNVSYRYSCFKEIAYVINLQYYLQSIKLNDEIRIGPEVRGTVVKKLKTCITIYIKESGIINSYDYIELANQCNSLQLQNLKDMFYKDLEIASKIQADFIVSPRMRSLPFLKILRNHLKNHNFKLIGDIDLEYISRKILDLMSLIKQLDYLWLSNLFNNTHSQNIFLIQDVIPLAKYLKKPIIGSVPLKRYSDFKLFENHEFLRKIDCMFITKSAWCNKYPLIVKKLSPIKNFRFAATEDTLASLETLNSVQPIVNFIIRTISSIECKAIFLYTKCEIAATALDRVEIYCPVFIVLPLEDVPPNMKEEKRNSRIDLSKSLNLLRNLIPILYTKEMNECGYKPIDCGIDYARRSDYLETGDFIITLEVGKEDGNDNVQLGVGEDVVIMRAFYVPPQKVSDKSKCN